jgi:Protein of unknown function (DUF3306)
VVEADGFLGRWARRKNLAREGKPLDEPLPAPANADPSAKPAPAAKLQPGQPPSIDSATQTPAEPDKPLTLEDVQGLTKESDYAPFMNRAVEPGVRNAAMKKLFSDPHFNVMDRMDIYIDDYSQPDPIPAAMLRKLASAKFLGLFDEEEKAEAKALAEKAAAEQGRIPVDHAALENDQDAASTRETAHTDESDSVAQSAPASMEAAEPGIASALPDPLHPSFQTTQPAALILSSPAQDEHAHTDLRLQPDDAAPAQKAGRIAE